MENQEKFSLVIEDTKNARMVVNVRILHLESDTGYKQVIYSHNYLIYKTSQGLYVNYGKHNIKYCSFLNYLKGVVARMNYEHLGIFYHTVDIIDTYVLDKNCL